MSELRLYNSATKKLEEFVPEKKTVGLYTCGPTVYHYAHIGNLRTFVFYDTLRRALVFLGYPVKHVMNITDVGHLTGDTDSGEDKLAAAAKRERKTAWQVADFYTKAFLRDLKRLNVIAPTKLPRATKHIREQIGLVKELEKNGYTYRTSDGIYYDTSKFRDYGKLSGQSLAEKAAGVRVPLGEKRNPADFALWKFSYPNGISFKEALRKVHGISHLQKRDMEWKSPWGIGFPGWHLECSAMARKYLGQPFDVHAGGIDHLPVHHENEIAQSVAAYDKPLARYWMHAEFLILGEEKMSKSLGNILTLEDFVRKGFDPLAFRYFLYSAHYRKPMTWSFEALDAAENALRKLRATVRLWKKPARRGVAEFEERFQKAIADDLDMPAALAVVWELVKSSELSAIKARTLLTFDQVLGLNLKKYIAAPLRVPPHIKKLLDAREQARALKAWSEADLIREEIGRAGFEVEDTREGQVIVEKRG